MSSILDLLRPGDVLTHAYSGAPNMAGTFTNIVQDGKLLPAALAAKQRGVIFDVGHGGGSFDFTVAEVAIAAGDVAIMELVEGPVTFVDTRNNKRDGKLQLKPVQTVINGVPFGRPYQSPFAVR